MVKVKHIDRALPTSGHTPMYVMHKFFARKQEDVIREYIKAYSDEGDIVLDPFCGSGVMVAEALRLGRKAIGIDINPVAIFITRNTIKYVNPKKIKKEFKKIEKDIKDHINGLYNTSCRKCKRNTLPAVCFTWDKGKLVDVRYECPHHGKLISPANKKDIELYEQIARGEIVENSKQRKTEKEYANMLYVAFRKVFNVLKPEGYCTITFHNPKLKYRNILYRSVVMAGFDFEKIIYQPPPRPSVKSLLQPYGSLEGDYFFRFRKPKMKRKKQYGTIDQKRVEILIVNVAKRIIAERGEPTHYTFIQNSIDPLLYKELKKYGLVMDFQPESVKKILNKYVGKIFELVKMEVGKKGQKTLMGKGWWFTDPSEHRLDIPLNKRVNEAIVNLLRRERKVSFTEVLTEVYTRFQNALTPEQHTIMDILKENAVPTKGGEWEIKPFVEEIGQQHEEMVFYLASLGMKTGYQIDIAKDEYGKFFEQKRLGAMFSLTPLEMKDATENQVKRIKGIDVIWHDGENIVAEFEVEHSTSIVDAVVRGSNIKSTKTLRIMVVPEEREDLVHRRFLEPAMQSMMKDMNWKVMTYKMLRNLYREYKGKKYISIEDFESHTRKPLSKKKKEEVIQQKLM